MNFFTRHKNVVLLFFFFILLPIILFLFWRGLTFINITDLWNKPDNKMNVLTNLAAAILYGLIGSILLIFRRAIEGFFFPARTEEERVRTQQEMSYLENLIDRFKQELPWDIEKYAALEAVFQEARRMDPRLKLVPNMEETQVQENPGARVDLLSFLRHEKGRIMIKGDPGTGKTLALRRFAVDQAEALKRTPGRGQLPIYVSLASYTGKTATGDKPEPLFDFLQRYLQEEFPDEVFLREHLTNYLQQSRLLLLFDGLNELPPNEYWDRYTEIENFLSKRTRNKVIITCRTLRYTSSVFSTIAISNLNNDQIKRFMAAYLGSSDAEKLYRKLASDGFMLRVCRNPFMLHMLVNRDAARPVPRSSAQLFEEHVQDSLAKMTSAPADIIDTLRKIAFTMQVQGKFAGTVSLQWLKTECPHIPAIEQHIEIANQTKLVDYVKEKIGVGANKEEPGEKKFRFYHQILQEYFAATELQQEWQAGKNLDKYFADYRWEDTILVCAGIAQNTEQFIRQIWSSGQTQPAAFWLATKAVGISGNRVSDSYYRTILQEANANLVQARNSWEGFSRTELAADTIKALAYIDDNNTTDILSTTLIENNGWIRELCVQTLGNSRDEHAHEALRSSTVKLRSIPVLRMVAPYFTRKELLAIAAISTMSFSLLSSTFWRAMQFLWILAPGFYLEGVYLGAHFFKVDPVTLIGRAVAVTLIIRFISENAHHMVEVVRSKVGWSGMLRFFRESAISNSIMIVLIMALWFFAGETNVLLAIGIGLIWCLLVLGLTIAVLLNIFSPLRMIYLLSSKFSKIIIFTYLLITTGYLIAFLIPFAWKVPSIKILPYIASPVENMLIQFYAYLLKPFLFVFYIGGILTLLGIVVHLITFILYWRLWHDKREFMKKGSKNAALHIVKVALSQSSWLHVRARAFKTLRVVDVPFEQVDKLDRLVESNRLEDLTYGNWLLTFFGDDLDLKGELQRTTYELLARAREEMRHAPKDDYIQVLFNRANSRFQSYNYQDSLTYLNQILSSNNKHLPALLLRGQTYTSLNRFDEALNDLNQVIANDNQSMTAFMYRGYAYYRLQKPDYSEALNDFSQAIALGTKDAWVFACRGDVYRFMLRFSEALADFDKAIALNDSVSWYFEYRGTIHYHLEHYAEAMSDFDRVLAFDDKNDSALAKRGMAQLYLQHYSEALASLTQAIAQNKTNDFYFYNRAMLYSVTNDMEACKHDLATALNLANQTLTSETDQEEQWFIHFKLACYHLVIGNTVDAQQQYDQFLTECTSLQLLSDAQLVLKNLLKIQPQSMLAQDFLVRLEASIHTLSQINSVPPEAPATN